MANIHRTRGKWKKILYEDQGVPDNFVDESFLDELKKNLYTRTYSFLPVLKESGVVTQQLSSVCLFVVCFVYMKQDVISPQNLFGCCVCLAVLGYVTGELIDKRVGAVSPRTYMDDVKTVVVLMAFSFSLAPVLMSLTVTISTDTIYMMTCCLLLANLLFHDYGARAAPVSQSVSLNAAIFASVCLASRLPTTWHAFTTVTLATQTFALWPMLRRKLKKNVVHSQVLMTVVLGALAGIAIATVSTVSVLLFISVHLFISFVCPAWLIIVQHCKQTIHGPWDEATIKD